MKVETDYKLKEALIKMGIDDMFSDEADLSGIVKSPKLKVSDAAHKAIIERTTYSKLHLVIAHNINQALLYTLTFQVDEEGTTAAAASTVKIVPMMLIMEEPKKFVADHPFLFILTKDMNPLFMGQFV
ncbi:unnamed protein product [Strongylus vulgaris]|uniref:Serpin domain-containing protein n=1 Tax=Strongylus vulgaris TaxID=40348 RepID=A0A3P7JUU4_STRVU|nr:unnamed protein product [Strongylus vulgaris]